MFGGMRVAIAVVALTPAANADGTPAPDALTAADTRICVTGYDHNRPDPFPGLGDFIGWAEAIERMPNGDILLVHSAGYGHVSWASPRRMAAPRQLADGTVLCFVNVNASWAGYGRAPAGFANDLNGLNDQQFVIRSFDNGQTWSEPIWIESPGSFYERAHGRPIQLSDGAILWPTYCEDIGGPESGSAADSILVSDAERDANRYLFGAIHRSLDSGKTWETISIIRRDGKDVDETAIAELQAGRLIMATRPDGGVLFSEDRGLTWVDSGTTIKKWGPTFRASQLFVLSDGTVVALATWHVYGFGGRLPHLCAWISTDGGVTWSEGVPLDTSSYGYPGGLLMEDESIMVSYCESSNAPNRIYVMRIRVNESRDGIEFLPIGGM